MNQPTMTNEQFALWFAASQGPGSKLYENAQSILNWIEKNQKKPLTPITPKGK
jgi:hypothetical protein